MLLGRLTADPNIKYTQSTNTMVVSFSLAVPRRFKQEGQTNVDFINIVAWSKTAEFVSKYFSKGQQVGVIGRIQTRNYKDDKGVMHYITEVIAEEVYFADSKKENEPVATTENELAPIQDDDMDTLPF